MKVRNLIEILSHMNPDAHVVIPAYFPDVDQFYKFADRVKEREHSGEFVKSEDGNDECVVIS